MPGPTAEQLAALKMLFGSAPDTVLAALDRSLGGSGPNMAQVHAMIGEERADRALKEMVFGPVAPLFGRRERGPCFPSRVGSAVWSALKARESALYAEAVEATQYLRAEDPPPEVLDQLCARAAAMLRDGSSPLRAEDAALGQELAAYLDLVPLARAAMPRIPEWLGRVDEERTVNLKLTLKDATALMADGAPRLVEIFQVNLAEPQQILRIISVATDRGNDRYLDESELAAFGQRLLDDVEARIERVRTFDPNQPTGVARGLGEDVTLVCQILGEMERSLELTRDGPWGLRATGARRKLAANVESRLRDMEDALFKALPMQKSRSTGRASRMLPCLDQTPSPEAVARAQGLFALLEATRASAQIGGYGALHAQVSTKLRERLVEYADDVIHDVNAGVSPEDDERARGFLEMAAEFLQQADDAKAAQLVRRRAAAAGAPQTSQDVA
jgi:hypothetical protein